MSLQENAARLRELGQMYPDGLKVFQSPEEIAALLSVDAAMTCGDSGMQGFPNDDPGMLDFIRKKLASGMDVSVFSVGKYSQMVMAGKGLFGLLTEKPKVNYERIK